MRLRTGSAYLFLLVSACALHAQVAAKPTDAPAPYTLKSAIQRVVVDVVVKDKHGAPVHGLKQSDFTVLENGNPQDIKNFEEHTGLTAAAAATAPRLPPLPPGQSSPT